MSRQAIAELVMIVCFFHVILGHEERSYVNAGPIENLVSQAESRYGKMNNIVLKFHQETIQDGEKKWARIESRMDDLGRYYIERVTGRITDEGKYVDPIRTLNVFDGQTSASFDFNFNPLKGQHLPGETGVHINLSSRPVYNTDWPYDTWLSRADFSRATLSVRKEGVHIEYQVDSARQHEAVIQIAPDQFKQKGRLVVDLSAGGLIKEARYVDSNGKVTLELFNTFKELEDHPGLFVANELKYERRAQKNTAANGKTYDLPAVTVNTWLDYLEVNSEDITDDVFRIMLPAGAYVFDARQQVHFRVGDEKLLDKEIERAASKAKEAQEKSDLNHPYNGLNWSNKQVFKCPQAPHPDNQ